MSRNFMAIITGFIEIFTVYITIEVMQLPVWAVCLICGGVAAGISKLFNQQRNDKE